MVNVFRRSFRTGIVTRGYPAQHEPAPEAFRGQIRIDTSRCDGEAACAAVCPAGAISVERSAGGWTWALTDARCVFCGLCVEACPTNALSASGEYELAVRDASDLNVQVTISKRANGS